MGTILDENNEQGGARQSLGGLPHVVDTLVALRQLRQTDLFGVVALSGAVTVGDGSGGNYYWNAADTTADNGTTVIRPAVVPLGALGRWNMIPSNAGTTATGSPTSRSLASRFADVINVKDFGATGLGIIDDSAAINAALAVGGNIYLPAGVYLCNSNLNMNVWTDMQGAGGQRTQIIFGGTNPQNKGIYITPIESSSIAFTGALTANLDSITIADPSTLAVDQQVLLLLGTDPYDAAQPFLTHFCRISSLVGTTVGIAPPLPEAVIGTTHILKTYSTSVDSSSVSNISFDYASGPVQDMAIKIKNCRGITIQHCRAIRSSIFTSVEACENVVVQSIIIQRVFAVHGSVHPFSIWGSSDCVFRDILVQECPTIVFFLESQNRGVLIENCKVFTSVGSALDLLHVVGGSLDIVVKNSRFHVDPLTPIFTKAQGSTMRTEDIAVRGLVKGFQLRDHSGYFVTDTKAYRHHKQTSIFLPLMAAKTAFTFNLPSGLYKRVLLYTSTTTGITSLYVLNTSNQGLNTTSSLIAGSVIDFSDSLGQYGSDFPFNSIDAKKVVYYTDGTVPVNSYICLLADYIEADGAWNELDTVIQQKLLPFQAQSVAGTVGEMVTDFNALLTKMINAQSMTPS